MKRVKPKVRRGQISEPDACAFIGGDGNALRRALGLKPWQFAISEAADRARSAGEIMARREQIEAELMSWEQH